MSTKIRLARNGCKKNPFYHIVVQDSRVKTRGRVKEMLGYFNPLNDNININLEALSSWLSKGAIASKRVEKIIKLHENASS